MLCLIINLVANKYEHTMAFTIRNSSQKTFGNLEAIPRSNIINNHESLIFCPNDRLMGSQSEENVTHIAFVGFEEWCKLLFHTSYQLDKVGPLTILAHLAQTCP